MKKIGIQLVIGLVAMSLALTALSCSKDKTGKQNAETKAAVDKKTEEIIQGVEISKKHVVIKVNGTDITMNDLINRMNQLAPKYVAARSQRTPEIDKKLQKEALDDLIFRELVFQEAGRQGMKVQPEAVKKTIASLRTSMGSEEAFTNNLKIIGATEESFRKMTEKDMLVKMIIDKEIYRKINVDEKRIKAVYMKEKAKFIHPESIDIEDVVVMKSNDEAADMKKGTELLASLRKNNNDSSKLPSDKTFIVRQGGLSRDEYPNIYKAVSDLKPGVLSGVIKEDDGLHIVRITGKMPAAQMTYEEAKADIEHKLMQPLIEKMKTEWENSLKKKAKIETMEASK